MLFFRLHSMDVARGADEAGYSCSGGFDINGDGFSDFIIGAPSGGTVGEFDGEAYVVFGQVRENSVFRERKNADQERTKFVGKVHFKYCLDCKRSWGDSS